MRHYFHLFEDFDAFEDFAVIVDFILLFEHMMRNFTVFSVEFPLPLGWLAMFFDALSVNYISPQFKVSRTEFGLFIA